MIPSLRLFAGRLTSLQAAGNRHDLDYCCEIGVLLNLVLLIEGVGLVNLKCIIEG